MKASTLYRIAAVFILLFDIGHTIGFLQHDPSWGVDSLLASMKSTHFNIQGFTRSYWEFFVGFGLFVTVSTGRIAKWLSGPASSKLTVPRYAAVGQNIRKFGPGSVGGIAPFPSMTAIAYFIEALARLTDCQ